MTVDLTEDNGWAVLNSQGQVIQAGFESNAAAWRWLDRQQGDPISRSEHVAMWIMGKMGVE